MIPYGKPCPQAPINTGRITTRLTIREYRKTERNGYVISDPEFPADLHLPAAPRNTNAPMAQTVITCHNPPSASGANPNP